MENNMSAKGGSRPKADQPLAGATTSGGKTPIKIFFMEFFYALTASVVVFSFLEIFWPGMILAYFNLNYLLLLWLVSGIIIIW